MPTYGITDEGFTRKTQLVILDEIQQDQLADIADDLDVSTDQPLGQCNGIMSRHLGVAWEQLEELYHSNDPDAATGRALENVSKLSGTFRRGSTPSEAVLTCNLDTGTTLINGEAYAALADQPDVRWTPSLTLYPDGYTAASDGPQPVTFVSEELGPIEGPAGQISVIATPIVGWNSVVNAADAELGLNVDTDPELRLRRERELATVGSATLPSIEANVSQAFPDDLQHLRVFENETDLTDADGRPPHSIEVLIFDGVVPSIDDDELAQVIAESKAGGIQSYGSESGNATVTQNGEEVIKPISFNRAEVLEVYVVYTLDVDDDYAGDAAVKDYVATQGNAEYAPDDEVIALFVRALPLAVKGVKDVLSFGIGYAPAPVGTTNLAVGVRQIARFDTGRIGVTT